MLFLTTCFDTKDNFFFPGILLYEQQQSVNIYFLISCFESCCFPGENEGAKQMQSTQTTPLHNQTEPR